VWQLLDELGNRQSRAQRVAVLVAGNGEAWLRAGRPLAPASRWCPFPVEPEPRQRMGLAWGGWGIVVRIWVNSCLTQLVRVGSSLGCDEQQW